MDRPTRSQLIEFVRSDASRAIADTVFAWNLRHPSNKTDEQCVAGVCRQVGIDRRFDDPTPEQIAERAAHERATWTPAERWSRQQVHPLPWVVPGAERIQRSADSVRELLGEDEREATE